MSITGLAAEHGPLSFQIGPFHKTLRPGPGERIGLGATGFLLKIEDKIIVNLGDTLKLLDQWIGIPRPDVRGLAEAVESMGIECRILGRKETVAV